MNRRYLSAPEHVAACDLGPATVLINYRSGEVQALSGLPAQWWAELAASGDPATPTALDPASAQSLLDQLTGAGLLAPTQRPHAWPAPVAGQPIMPSWGTHETQAGRAPIPDVPFRALLPAALSLAVVLATMHAGRAARRMSRITGLIERASRRALRPATRDRVHRAVHAVRRVGLLAPGRVACLEESAAVALSLAWSRERVTWCHGVAADPIRLHAWVETDSQPVAEPESTRRYTALRTIPDRQRR
jgi:hypothetical protein